MSLTYPIAASGTDALTEPKGFARTRAAAEKAAGQGVEFQTEWLRPGPERAEEWQSAVQSALSHGAVQIYETEKGRPVIAISFWKLVEIADDPVEPPVDPNEGQTAPVREDHADDLYFRTGRTRKKKPKPVDPNQLDLFRGAGPNQQGYEERDPNNPNVMIADEGDGTAFGLAPRHETEPDDEADET